MRILPRLMFSQKQPFSPLAKQVPIYPVVVRLEDGESRRTNWCQMGVGIRRLRWLLEGSARSTWRVMDVSYCIFGIVEGLGSW